MSEKKIEKKNEEELLRTQMFSNLAARETYVADLWTQIMLPGRKKIVLE